VAFKQKNLCHHGYIQTEEAFLTWKSAWKGFGTWTSRSYTEQR